MKLDRHNIIILIIAAFILIKLLTIGIYGQVWWDSSVYIGMGKYIFSLGNSGLWEDSRPIVWPFLLGFMWKIGLSTILSGRVLEIVFGGVCILLTYLIGNKLFSRKAALLASLFLAVSPTFFFFNGIMLTEIISTAFSLTAIYFFINKKYAISGIFFGIAFMTRFLQLFAFIAAIITILMRFDSRRIKHQANIFVGFIIAIAPFFILNQALYGNAVLPFLQQISLTGNSGWLNYRPIGYYFIELFRENFLYFLSIFGIFLLCKNKNIDNKIVPTSFITFFIFFSYIKQKEMRFLIVLFPYMYLLVSYAAVYIMDKLKIDLLKRAFIILVILSFAFSAPNIMAYSKNEHGKNSQYRDLMAKFQENYVDGRIWASSPIMPVSSDKKIDKLMYYPIFNEKRKTELINEAKMADFIFMDSCDLACKPRDTECEEDKKELIDNLKQNLNTLYTKKSGQCEQFIFRN